MKLIGYFCEPEDYLSLVSHYLKNARSSVWCGSRCIDFSPRLFEGESLEELLLRLDSRGVGISIRVSHVPRYPVPPSLRHLVTVVTPQRESGFYHQKFLLIDDEYLFIGGRLFAHRYRSGPATVFKCLDSALFYLLDMSHWPDYWLNDYLKNDCVKRVPAPHPLLRERQGLETLYQTIDGARRYIYIHGQYLFSTDYTNNRVLERVRLRARANPELRVLVVINEKNPGHSDILIRHLFPVLFKLSAHYVSDNMSSPNIKVCYLRDGNQPVFIRDGVVLVDGVALLTSANFVDRSLDRDTELGVLERDDGTLICRTLCQWLSRGDSTGFGDLWSQTCSGQTVLQPVKRWSTGFHWLIRGVTRLFGVNRLLS